MMKKISALLLAGLLSLSLIPSAGAEGPVLSARPPLIAPNPMSAPTLSVNGVSVDISGLPGGEGIPMRAFVEADEGQAVWKEADKTSIFSLEGTRMSVDLVTGTVTVDRDQVFEGGQLLRGVTYAPVEAVEAMEGVSVTRTETGYAITTASADPLTRLAKEIREATGMGTGMKNGRDELESYYGIRKENFESVVGYMPMMISADTVIVGKVAPGKMEEAKADLEARKQATIQSFEQYLPGPLKMAQNGRIVASGDYVMLLISPDNETGIQLFQDTVRGLAQQ